MAPVVSVIIATFNRDKYIRRAIESVLEQTCKNVEIIVVDDGSEDRTKEVIKPYLKNKNFYYIQQKNKGASAARNKGIELSKAEYIAILDSDDSWHDIKKLQKQIDFLENNPGYVLTGGGVIIVDSENREISKYLFLESDEDIRGRLLIDNTFVHSSVLYRKKSWRDAGGYDENLKFSEDKDLWLKLGKIGKLYNFPAYFTRYLRGGESHLSNHIRRNLKATLKMKVKYRKNYHGFTKAVFVSFASFLYSFLPFKNELLPIFYKLRTLVFGSPLLWK